ncbi:dihydrofolate reductase [Niallia sp. 01092]|uniref:dihydrofolate reductase n=1 Tax=unclassified Niallia TaxID=2837522 RepID=UPI003FD2594D
MISLIVAMDQNNVIGYKNELPWHLPEDLKYFKKVTTGHPIVMGRKTRDSIGRNLPNRENVILTKNEQFKCEDCTILHSMEELKAWSETKNEEEIFIIGGAEIFKETLNIADRLYITKIDEAYQGDTYFPDLDWSNWKIISEEKGIKDEKNNVDYTFFIYERKGN